MQEIYAHIKQQYTARNKQYFLFNDLDTWSLFKKQCKNKVAMEM
jgi:hypothetical protein